MASTINATSSGSGGLISTGDASGQLELQTNGTVAMTIDGSQNITFTKAPTGINAVQSSVIGTNTAAVAGTYYTLTASLTLTLPSAPSAGNFVGFSNLSGTTTATIARNGSNIMGAAEDLTLDTTAARGTLIYADSTRGWVLFND